MPIFTWTVEALVIDEGTQNSRNEYGTEDPHPRVVILVDDEEWLRCHYDEEREEWVETASAHMTGHLRSSQRTVSELLSWLLSSRSRVVVDKIVRKVQGHFDSARDRAAAQDERDKADELRKQAEV
jgi:hypothetical protein